MTQRKRKLSRSRFASLYPTLIVTANSVSTTVAKPSGRIIVTGGAGNATISVANGASTGTLTVLITDNALLEATETVIAQISNSSNAAVTIGTATATANITDNDTANQPPTAVVLTPTSASLAENASTANGSFESKKYFHRLLGDVSGNGIVDAADKRQVLLAQGGLYSVESDANGDGLINIADTTLVTRAVGRKLKGGLFRDD